MNYSLPSLRWLLLAAYGAAVLAIGSYVATQVELERDEAIVQTQKQLEGTARALEEHVARALQQANDVLIDVIALTKSRASLKDIPEQELHDTMAERIRRAPQIRSMAAFAPDGTFFALSSNFPVRGRSGPRGETFRRLSESPQDPLAIGRTVKGPITGRYVFPLTRKVPGPDGRLQGYLSAGFDPQYFSNFYDQLGLPQGGTVVVGHNESARVIVRYPFEVETLDTDMSASPLYSTLRGVRQGTYVTDSVIDGVRRVVAFRRLNDFPLLVAVTLPLETVLQPWTKARDRLVIGALAFCIVLAALFAMIYFYLRRMEQATEALRRANEDLERRVRERTRELEQANRDLASFSYSVSHDLRSPLRAINGFCQIIEEDYRERLDDYGRSCLARVRAASERMGHLIDSLLALSHLAKRQLSREPVDLSAAAREVAKELEDGEPDRRCEFVIAPGLAEEADPTLVRDLLMNLFGNAWKFTARRARASIEFGGRVEAGRTVYHVRDNGVGFDPAYADKLFQPFERLHETGVYSGHGIGLATVKRIVELHDGVIWAAGEPDRGATFFFTLRPARAEASAPPSRQPPQPSAVAAP